MKRSLNPTWNETFEIEVDHYDKLILDVYDENRMTRDDFLGRVDLPLNSLPRFSPAMGCTVALSLTAGRRRAGR